MEISLLLTDEINLEKERSGLEGRGMQWDELESALNTRYRESSKKGLFRCKCCNAVTYMVLHEGKVCHFRHRSEEECSGSRNYKRYTTATGKFESQKHSIGRAIIKDQLQANFKHVSAKVYDGYFFKSELNIIPDVIVEFPDEVWTFDYVTGTKTDQYQRYLLKKQETYASQGFKSFFLFDESQLVIKEGNRVIALSKGEKGSLRFHLSDKNWEDVIIELSNHFGIEAIVPERRLQLADHLVHWILYVNDEFNGQKFKITQLEINQSQQSQIPDQWYMIIGRGQLVPFTDLFRYNRDTHQFSWESSQIDAEELNEIVATAEHQQRQIEDDRKAMQEEQERKRRQYEERRRLNSENSRTFNEIASSGGKIRPSSAFQEPEQYKPTIFDKNTEDRVKDCLRVLSIMESTDFPKTNPAFVDRIKECRDDLDLFHRTGELPKRIAGNIQMMKYALQID